MPVGVAECGAIQTYLLAERRWWPLTAMTALPDGAASRWALDDVRCTIDQLRHDRE